MVVKRATINRRNFIRITAVAGAALGASTCSDRAPIGEDFAELHETRQLMGTIANLTVLARERDLGQDAVRATFDQMRRLESILSRFLVDSQLSQLNRTGSLRAADPALIAVLESSLTYGRLTDGAFDVTVEPILASYRTAVEQRRDPVRLNLEEMLGSVDYRRISLETRSVHLASPDMAVTLDGIAKGYVIDRGVDELIKRGYDQILVEVGGDLMTGSRSVGGWKVGVRPPRSTSRGWVATAELSNQALATSGDYLNAFTQDYRLHHIVDPRSGLSPAELCTVSVVAPSAMDADALSTSLMVLGIADGIALIEKLPGVEALLISKDQALHTSSGFPAVASTST